MSILLVSEDMQIRKNLGPILQAELANHTNPITRLSDLAPSEVWVDLDLGPDVLRCVWRNLSGETDLVVIYPTDGSDAWREWEGIQGVVKVCPRSWDQLVSAIQRVA